MIFSIPYRKTGRAGWAELVGQTEQSNLAVTLDFYSVWYRDHQVFKIAKSERVTISTICRIL